ncbi:alpha/beta fold hydrolase [Kribbella sp. VKM Ac-2568]|uniref:alpha/beta fold hydrolase n=1 Tax=Kribbella sp. VKM Ac-2568 TaxID=2512219 RepID=UPI00104E3B69|nr:alpha/beta hydrolase [Kribbella sp. VKM Ac-2568]TCM50487.1 pimeloyl-ACP methyl ester carboxylesterase [Kribbella sp. VKM Ac-2568]
MSIQIQAAAPTSDTEVPTTPRRGRIGRIIAGSLLAGATIALALTLGVFAGATESIITGSILLAFGIGWGLLATLSVRLTTQPQRWAGLPAAAMTASGLLLLAFQPGHAVLTTVGWVWPVLVLVLAVWMHSRMRRALSGRGRRLLTPVMAVLALASIGATYENITVLQNDTTYPATGRTFEVAGHRLHLDCRGSGGPTVVLFNGLGGVSASWARITGDVARTGRVCAYDRAGQGWSEDAEHPQDGVTAATDLHTLLAKAGEHGPYLLVGHSIGGTYSMTYAARYPDQVAGLVLLDSSSPEQFTRMPDYPGQYAVMRRITALTPTLARLGLSRVVAVASPSHLPAEAADRVRAVTANAHAARNMRDEVSMLHQVFAQAGALTTLHDLPLAVVTASETLKDTGWAAAQDQLATLSGNRMHQVVEASHLGLLEDEPAAAESTRAITEVISAIRTGSHLESK